MEDNDLLSLHETHGYLATVKRLDGHNSVLATFPENKLLNKPASLVTYSIDDTGICKTDADYLGRVDGPEYSRRVVFVFDLLMTYISRKLNAALTCNYDKNGQEVEETILLLDAPTTEEQLDKENRVSNFLSYIMLDVDCKDIAKSNDLLEGYELLVDVYRRGGI